MAELLGLAPATYGRNLRRLKLGGGRKDAACAPPETPLMRLQAELQKLIAGEELPDKSRAEALMALARAVKTVGELAAEAPAPEREGEPVIGFAAVQQALARIDRRIEELAEKRARDILGGGADACADRGGGG